MNNNCKFAGGGYCMCDACKSVRETLENLKQIDTKEILAQEEVSKVFQEMENALKGCKSE